MQSHLAGAHTDAQQRADLFVGMIFHVVQHHDLAQAGGQRLQRAVDVDT